MTEILHCLNYADALHFKFFFNSLSIFKIAIASHFSANLISFYDQFILPESKHNILPTVSGYMKCDIYVVYLFKC